MSLLPSGQMRVSGYASRAGGADQAASVFLAGLVAPSTLAPRLLCGQCGKRLDDADETLACYCRDTRDDEAGGEPWRR